MAKTLKKWTRESKLELQACFDCTNWSVFEAAATDLNDLTDTVTSYIRFCEDLCVQTKTFCTYNNSKPWFTPNLRKMRQAIEVAHISGDRDLYKQARNKLTKEIKVAKISYSEKLKYSLSAKDPASVLERPATNYKLQETIPPPCRKSQTGRQPE